MKKGFTLVELSIVLVIIGLLIGGILIGQSLIESAKVNSVVQQIHQIQIAVEQFKSKYRYFPGDSPLHNPKGDGDGITESEKMHLGTQSYTNTPYDYEVIWAWAHLWQDGFLQDQYDEFNTSPSSGTSVNQGHYPPMAMGEAEQRAGATTYTNMTGGYYIRAIDYSPSSNRQIQNWAHRNCVYTTQEAIAIDAKMDDGTQPGLVSGYETCAMYPSGSRSYDCYDGSGNYEIDLDDGEKRCALHFRIMDWDKDAGNF